MPVASPPSPMVPNSSPAWSGVQLKLSRPAPSQPATSRSAPPLAAATMTLQRPSPQRLANAISRPSGDHAGSESDAPGGGVLSRRGGAGVVGCTWIAARLSPGATALYATMEASGDSVGDSSNPGAV